MVRLASWNPYTDREGGELLDDSDGDKTPNRMI
jgi:hypothetical protein